jgi:RsiW-degrading membrane proteinase PrsW (M82 family)
MNTTVKQYILYNSPLHQKKYKIFFWVLFVILAAISFFGWRYIYIDDTLAGVFEWMPYALAGSIVAYFLLSYFDSKRGVRILHVVTILAVIFITAPIALIINRLSPLMLWSVGFNEEFFKILPVILLAFFLPNIIRTKKDGIIYGAFAGMGFNIIEIASYITTVLQTNSNLNEVLFEQSTRLAIWGFGIHIILTAFVGLGVGIFVESKKHGWRRWVLPVFIYLVAAVMHSAYDLGLVGIVTVIIVFVISLFTGESLENMDATALTREGAMHTSAIWTHYVYNIIPIIIIVWQFMKSAHKEQKIIQKNLKDESVDIVQENEKCAIEMEPLFSKRKYRYDTLPKKIRKKIAGYQNLLAYLKEYSKIIEDKKEFEDVARVIKKEIIQLRTVK